MNAQLSNNPLRRKSPIAFFLLGIALGMLYFISAAARVLPVAVLNYFGAFLPALTALILVYRENGAKGMGELLGRSFDYKRITSRIWYLPVFLLWPLILFIQYALAPLSGLPVSSPNILLWSPVGIAASFLLALGEELGWTGYVIEPMQERFGALTASILLGIFWSSVHIPYFASSGAAPDWILWSWVYVVATRVLFVWVYNNTGKSLFAIAVMHTLFNQVWQVFPLNADLVGMSVPTFYSPSNLALTTIILGLIVVFLWGPRTLAQFRYLRSSNGASMDDIQRAPSGE